MKQYLILPTTQTKLCKLPQSERYSDKRYMMSIPGIGSDEAREKNEALELDDIKILFISLLDLIKAKEAGARPQYMIDVDKLKEAKHNNI